MELTYEETLQLDNSQEHLRVVLVNLRIANEELTKVLKENNDTKLGSKKLKEEQVKLSKENSEIKRDSEQTIYNLNKREESLVSRESEVDEREEELKSKIIRATNKLSSINDKILIKDLEYKKLIKDKEKETEVIKEETKILKKEEILYTKNNKEKDIEVTNFRNKIISLKSEKEKLEKDIDNSRKKYKKELEEAIKLIEEEKDKIKNPSELIYREQDKLDITRKDLLIIKRRLTAQFKNQNPERILPIELQNKD